MRKVQKCILKVFTRSARFVPDPFSEDEFEPIDDGDHLAVRHFRIKQISVQSFREDFTGLVEAITDIQVLGEKPEQPTCKFST